MTTTILRNDLIKGALIAYLKSVSEVTDKLEEYGSSSAEIRESQWQSQDFVYPSIRLRISRNVLEGGDCKKASLTVSWMVFTEEQSSLACDEISGIIASYFQSRQFSVTFRGDEYRFSWMRATLVPAVNVGGTIWRSEVILEGYASLA